MNDEISMVIFNSYAIIKLTSYSCKLQANNMAYLSTYLNSEDICDKCDVLLYDHCLVW